MLLANVSVGGSFIDAVDVDVWIGFYHALERNYGRLIE